MPDILAQNDFLRGPPSGCGAFNPGLPGFALLYEARPLAFNPPLGFFPSFRCHAGVLAIEHRHSRIGQCSVNVGREQHALTGDQNIKCLALSYSVNNHD